MSSSRIIGRPTPILHAHRRPFAAQVRVRGNASKREVDRVGVGMCDADGGQRIVGRHVLDRAAEGDVPAQRSSATVTFLSLPRLGRVSRNFTFVASCGGAPLSIIAEYVRAHPNEGALPPGPEGRGGSAKLMTV